MLSADCFADWNDVSVAQAIEYSKVVSISQYLTNRENYNPELSTEEIGKFQHILYNECIAPDVKSKISFDDFIAKRKKDNSNE